MNRNEEPEKHTSGAKALAYLAELTYGLKPVPFNDSSFSAASWAEEQEVEMSADIEVTARAAALLKELKERHGVLLFHQGGRVLRWKRAAVPETE